MKKSVSPAQVRTNYQIPKMDKLILSDLKGEKEIQKFIRKTFRNKEIWTPCDVGKNFKERREKTIQKFLREQKVKAVKPFIISNITSPSYGKLDNDCWILTGASIFILDTLLKNGIDFEQLYPLLPEKESLIEDILHEDFHDSVFDDKLIASVEYVLRNRNKDFVKDDYDESGYYRSLLQMDNPNFLAKESQYREHYEKLIRLMPQSEIDKAIEYFYIYWEHFQKKLQEIMDSNENIIQEMLGDINRGVENINAVIDMVNNLGHQVVKSNTPFPIKCQANEYTESMLSRLSTIENMTENIAEQKMTLLRQGTQVMKETMDSLSGWKYPQLIEVYDGSFAVNPYAICFALLYLIESGSDIPWLYGNCVQMMYSVAKLLPWGLLLENYNLGEFKDNVSCQEHEEDIEKTDWYLTKYAPEPNGEIEYPKMNRNHFIYLATGTIMPRNLQPCDELFEFMWYYNVVEEDMEMLLNCMALVNNVKPQYQALNFVPKETENLTEPTQETPKGEEYNNGHQKIVKNLNQKLYESQCQLQESQRTTSMLQEKLKEKDNEIAKLLDVLQSMESEDNSLEEQIDDTSYPFVARDRIVIFGGHDTFIKTMKQLIVGNVKFIRKETAFDEAWITNANYIWIQTNAISHSMYGKIMSVAKRCHKNVSYFKHSGAKSCLNQIVQKCESQNGET